MLRILGKSSLLAFIIFVTFCMYGRGPGLMTDAKGMSYESEVKETLLEQTSYWNKGNLDKFMSFYLNSPDTSYSSSGKTIWGYDSLAKLYKDKYGSNKSTMGNLSLTDLKVERLGKNNVFCIGKFEVSNSKKKEVKGTFTLILTRSGKGWKIIHDHSSSELSN